jgi:aspartate oxidase
MTAIHSLCNLQARALLRTVEPDKLYRIPPSRCSHKPMGLAARFELMFLCDMEFIHFIPTVLWSQDPPAFFPDNRSVRGEGGLLYNSRGTDL